jgi:hypothetical protein
MDHLHAALLGLLSGAAGGAISSLGYAAVRGWDGPRFVFSVVVTALVMAAGSAVLVGR